jgi:hypothetical protein
MNPNAISKLVMMATTVLALASLALFAAPAHAIVVAGGGGRVGSLDPKVGDAGVAVGAHVDMETAGSHWHLEPNVLYWNGDPLSGFDTNVDAFYHFNAQRRTGPYLGGGVGVSMVDHPVGGTTTDGLANMFGGVQFPTGRNNNVFLEGRYTFTDVSQASLSLGVTLH